MAMDDDVNDHAVDYSEDAENSDNRLSHHTVIHIDTHAMGCVAVLFSENHKQNQTSIRNRKQIHQKPTKNIETPCNLKSNTNPSQIHC